MPPEKDIKETVIGMVVWLVTVTDDEQRTSIAGVFSTQKKAERFIELLQKTHRGKDIDCTAVPWSVDRFTNVTNAILDDPESDFFIKEVL